MSRAGLRVAYKASVPANVLLIALVLWDHFGNGGAWRTGLLVAYAVLLAALVLLLFVGPARYVSLAGPGPDDPDSIDYGRNSP